MSALNLALAGECTGALSQLGIPELPFFVYGNHFDDKISNVGLILTKDVLDMQRLQQSKHCSW